MEDGKINFEKLEKAIKEGKLLFQGARISQLLLR